MLHIITKVLFYTIYIILLFYYIIILLFILFYVYILFYLGLPAISTYPIVLYGLNGINLLFCFCSIILYYRPISQTVFMLSSAINRGEPVCATVIMKHNYMLMCNHKITINIMLCLLNSTGHI